MSPQPPSSFIVRAFEPKLHVEVRSGESANSVWVEELLTSGESLLSTIDAIDRWLLDRKIINRAGDLLRVLGNPTSTEQAAAGISAVLRTLGHDPASLSSTREQLFALLGNLQSCCDEDHDNIQMLCHDCEGQSTELPAAGTHFGYCIDGTGSTVERPSGHIYPIYPRTFFSVPGACLLRGPARIITVSCTKFQGEFVLGGPIDDWGRLRYIDGCSDTLLVPPPIKGDPCLNALYFPPGIEQTRHTHPSVRLGVVFAGRGLCRTETGNHDLLPASVFVIPSNVQHAFSTAGAAPDKRPALGVIAFHPDSDFGPTDNDHPMLNRTFMSLDDRLRSARRLQTALR